MKKRIQTTLILVTAARVVRADFDGAPDAALPRIWKSPRKPGTGVPEAVRSALALGGLPGTRIWVLAEDFWAQSLALPTAQTDRLAPQELADALAFEAEPFSNLPPGETVVGVRGGKPENSTTPFWVVECARSDMVALQEIATRAGGRLAGASHPGGLPVALDETRAGQAWRRLEKWQAGWVLVQSDGRTAVTAQSLSASRLAEAVSSGPERPEGLAADAGVWRELPLAGRIAPACGLDDDVLLRRWLAAWARCVAMTPERTALLFAPAVPTPFNRYVKVGTAAEVAVLVLCLLHASGAGCRHDHLARKLGEVRESVGQIEQVERENTAARQQIAALQQKQREYKEAAELLARQRRAFPLLLRALAEAHSPDVVIRELRNEGSGRLRISGLSLTPDAVDDLTGRLSSALREGGWVVAPAGKSAQGLLDDAGPWHFVLRATQTDLADLPDRPAVSGPEEQPW